MPSVAPAATSTTASSKAIRIPYGMCSQSNGVAEASQ